MSERLPIKSTITFLYYQDLAPAAEFYQTVLGLACALDAGWAKIYAVPSGGFIGLVCGDRGHLKAQRENAVLITLLVQDLGAWHDYLAGLDVPGLTEIRAIDEVQIQSFFLRDPGGYAVEVQQFLDPEVARRFGQSD
jgi:catechol-2,3-dioxygenase